MTLIPNQPRRRSWPRLNAAPTRYVATMYGDRDLEPAWYDVFRFGVADQLATQHGCFGSADLAEVAPVAAVFEGRSDGEEAAVVVETPAASVRAETNRSVR